MDDKQDVLTIPEAAGRLRVHPRTVRHLIERGDLAAVRVGRQYRILSRNLEAFLRGEGSKQDSERP